MNVDGSGLTSLVRSDYTEGAHDDPVWSPDGRRVAFVSHRDGNSGIYIMDLSATAAGSSPPDFRTINRHPEGGCPQCGYRDEGPVWSPDGSQIAFVSGRDGSRKIYVVDPDQSMPVPVSSVPVERGVPQWSPDGRWIAYIAGPPENRVIHLVNPGSQAHQELRHAKGEIAELRWVPAETPVRVGRRSER
jgi:Tol biopolymer transport system component